jgi:hypothetical protein
VVLRSPKRPTQILGAIQPPIQWLPEFFPRGVERQSRKVVYSLLSNDEVKNEWRYTSIPPYAFVAWTGRALRFDL